MGLLATLGLSAPKHLRDAPPLSQVVTQTSSTRDEAAGKPAAPAAKTSRLSQAADAWRQTHGEVNERIMGLKTAVRAHHVDEHPQLLEEIQRSLAKLDQILNNLDHRLADTLANAGAAKNDGDRKTELQNAKALLTKYINYVKSEPLLSHIDNNPFGVTTNLKAILAAGLRDAAKAIA